MLKAYICLETDERTGGVVFAKTKRDATKIGANLFSNDEPEYLDVSRAARLDKFSETGVPAKVLVRDGWHFECWGCGIRIDYENMSEEGLSVDGIVGVEGGEVYCSHVCRMSHKAREAHRNAYGQAFLDMLRDEVRGRFPGAAVPSATTVRDHVYVPAHSPDVIFEALVYFDFPGQKIGPAQISYSLGYSKIGPPELVVLCCSGDRGAFEFFAREQKDRG